MFYMLQKHLNITQSIEAFVIVIVLYVIFLLIINFFKKKTGCEKCNWFESCTEKGKHKDKICPHYYKKGLFK